MTTLTPPTADCVHSTTPVAERPAAIALTAETRLRESGYLALRDVSCEVRDGVLDLHGHLPTYYLKQIAQALVIEIEGVRRVINRIEVIALSKPNTRRTCVTSHV